MSTFDQNDQPKSKLLFWLAKAFWILIVSSVSLSVTSCASTPPPPCCPEGLGSPKKSFVHDFSSDSEESFKDDVLALVDHKNNVFLLRGRLPEKDGQFAYDGLVEDIKRCISKHETTLSSDFKLMCISLMSHVQEHEKIEIEEKWFAAHPEKGCLWNFPIFGALINPVTLSVDAREAILRHYDIDDLKYLMTNLKTFLNTECPSDLVIYIHCALGKDRTGEVCASYLMEFKGYSYKKAVALDEKIAKRNIKTHELNAIRWYAFYLRDIQGVSSVGEID